MCSFQICLQFFVLPFGQIGRNPFSPLAIKKANIFAINPAALVSGRIWADNIERTILHEVIVDIAAAGLATTREPRIAVRYRASLRIHRWPEWVPPRVAYPEDFETFFIVAG